MFADAAEAGDHAVAEKVFHDMSITCRNCDTTFRAPKRNLSGPISHLEAPSPAWHKVIVD